MEQQISTLCSQLLRTQDPDEAEVIGEQLRSAIHVYVEDLRYEAGTTIPVLNAMAA